VERRSISGSTNAPGDTRLLNPYPRTPAMDAWIDDHIGNLPEIVRMLE
jgi:hypothetical protein